MTMFMILIIFWWMYHWLIVLYHANVFFFKLCYFNCFRMTWTIQREVWYLYVRRRTRLNLCSSFSSRLSRAIYLKWPWRRRRTWSPRLNWNISIPCRSLPPCAFSKPVFSSSHRNLEISEFFLLGKINKTYFTILTRGFYFESVLFSVSLIKYLNLEYVRFCLNLICRGYFYLNKYICIFCTQLDLFRLIYRGYCLGGAHLGHPPIAMPHYAAFIVIHLLYTYQCIW